MRRMTYVDKDGNQIDQSFENKKLLLKFFFVFGTVLPLIFIVLIIVTVVQNKNCTNIYNSIKEASLKYAEDQDKLPEIEGDNTEINIGNLYSEQYLRSINTNNTLCSGTVKITKYKNEYIYTLDVKNCDICSTNKRYKGWSALQNTYPKNKAIVDVIPYYNYYDRQISTTEWSKYYEQSELSDEISEYNINLPIEENTLPEIPAEATTIDIEADTTNYYRYVDKKWKWYDIEGNYSEFSSEQPNGYEKIDTNTERYTQWSEYSLNYPEEKSYRSIEKTTGYKYYYLDESNKKVYYKSGKYIAKEEVDTQKYNQRDSESATLYRYRDKQWRWYNGQKRNYSTFSSVMPNGKPFKDLGIEVSTNPSSWSAEKKSNSATEEYRVEEVKLMTRFRINYEILSLKVLDKPLEKTEFESNVGENISEFNSREDKKIEVTYKFKYRKS